jgi:hypothetical protein
MNIYLIGFAEMGCNEEVELIFRQEFIARENEVCGVNEVV